MLEELLNKIIQLSIENKELREFKEKTLLEKHEIFVRISKKCEESYRLYGDK